MPPSIISLDLRPAAREVPTNLHSRNKNRTQGFNLAPSALTRVRLSLYHQGRAESHFGSRDARDRPFDDRTVRDPVSAPDGSSSRFGSEGH